MLVPSPAVIYTLPVIVRALFVAALLLSACQKPAVVKTVKARRATVEATVNSVTSGTIRAEQSAELAFGAVGRVSALYVNLGDRVRKGDVLAEVENTDLRTAVARSEAELKRRQSMGSLAVSASDLDTARLAVDSAKMNLDKTLIRAPYDGIIAELNLEVGQLSQITAVIPKAPIRIVDVAPRYVRAEIDEVDLPRVKEGLAARVKILAVRKEPYTGVVRKVIQFVSSVREQDRTSEIEVTLDAAGVLLPAGASGDVEVVTDVRRDVIALPSRSVLGRGNDRFVYVSKEGRAVKTPVRIGLSNYELTELTSNFDESLPVIIPSDTVELTDGLKVEDSTPR